MDGLFLNQKTNNNILNIEDIHFKKKNFNEKVNGSVEIKINIQGSSINQKPNSTMSVILFTGADFEK